GAGSAERDDLALQHGLEGHRRIGIVDLDLHRRAGERDVDAGRLVHAADRNRAGHRPDRVGVLAGPLGDDLEAGYRVADWIGADRQRPVSLARRITGGRQVADVDVAVTGALELRPRIRLVAGPVDRVVRVAGQLGQVIPAGDGRAHRAASVVAAA